MRKWSLRWRWSWEFRLALEREVTAFAIHLLPQLIQLLTNEPDPSATALARSFRSRSTQQALDRRFRCSAANPRAVELPGAPAPSERPHSPPAAAGLGRPLPAFPGPSAATYVAPPQNGGGKAPGAATRQQVPLFRTGWPARITSMPAAIRLALTGSLLQACLPLSRRLHRL